MDNQPKGGFYTSEFQLTLVKTAIGVLVMTGVVAPAKQDDLTNAITMIVGGVIALVPSLTYIISRTWLKAQK